AHMAMEALPEREVLAALIHPTAERLEEHPMLTQPQQRALLYAWLCRHERAIFTDDGCRTRLREARLFPTEQGRLLKPTELVNDPDLPDLGIDWSPNAEIPPKTLELLARHLGIGRPELAELVHQHLLPDWHRAARAGDPLRVAALIHYLARRMESWEAPRIRAMLPNTHDAPLLLEDSTGHFRPVDALLMPPETRLDALEAVFGHTLPTPSMQRYSGLRGFLMRLGVPTQPSLEQLSAGLEGVRTVRQAWGMATLLSDRLASKGGEDVLQLPLKARGWIPDRSGRLRRPEELYVWELSIAVLVGEFDHLYIDERMVTVLGEALVGSLGFRTARDVRLDEVVDHIASRVEEAAPLPFRVYLWMDKGLGEGWLSRQELKERLKPLRWVCTDDGSYFNHRHVLGVQALPLFGQRRGYWQQGLERCPHLCNLFQIAPEVTSTMVAHFLREIGNDVVDQGDQPLLQENPALPRMLLNCYAALGAEVKGVPRLAPVILAEQRGGKTPGAQRLVSASTRNLLRSDTPTLEAMFEGVGTFFLAARGGAEERSSIAQFHDALGVRRLRDAYTLKVDEAGQDRSTARSLQLNALRGVLRALLGVLPRVQAQRTLLTEEGWVFDERLRALAGSGRLKAIEQLRVSYQLVGVGTVQSESSAVYDPS
ncbi:MAG: hypothetical protein AAFS10_22440, partial [Myxococcota bacterium]